MKGESKNFLFRVSKCQRFLNSFSFFLTNTKKKLDLLRDRLIEIFRTLLFPLHARERERERVKSQRSALLESFKTKK